MSERKIEYDYEIRVNKKYLDLTYDQLIETLKETEACFYGVDVRILRNEDDIGYFLGTYDVIVSSVRTINKPNEISKWYKRLLDQIEYLTK